MRKECDKGDKLLRNKIHIVEQEKLLKGVMIPSCSNNKGNIPR
jgi:hypothetical protein